MFVGKIISSIFAVIGIMGALFGILLMLAHEATLGFIFVIVGAIVSLLCFKVLGNQKAEKRRLEREAEEKRKQQLAEKKSNLKSMLAKQYGAEWDNLYNINSLIKTNGKTYIQRIKENSDTFTTLWLSHDDKNFYLSEQLPAERTQIEKAVDLLNTIESVQEVQDDLHHKILLRYDIIPFDKVIYFLEKGEINTQQSVTSSGGGINLGGAVLGSIIAGDAGIILGGREKTVVSTTHYDVDNRFILLKYYDKDNKIKTLYLPYKTVNQLMEVISEKEYSILQLNNGNEKNVGNTKNDISERLASLDKLHEQGVITQEEYDNQRSKIISSI